MMATPELSEANVLKLSLANDLREVRRATSAAREFLKRQGCDDETLMVCDLALVEACNNAIQHAPADAKQKPVLIEIIWTSSQIDLRITDHTAGFEWPERVELPSAENERGRGLFLIQSLMDSARYFRSAGENVLVLRKTRSTAPVARANKESETPAQAVVIAPDSVNAAPKEPARNGFVTVESEIAGTIQRAFLLDRLPELPGIELAAFCRMAHQFGGDFYDVMKAANGAALLVIADVMGKGALAALFAAILRTALRSVPEMASRPAALLSRVNQLLFQELSTTGMFITAQLAFIEPARSSMTIACAGHCPLLLKSERSADVEAHSPDGMPLGILPDTLFAETVVDLTEYSRALIYTDGITEAINPAGERYGQARLMNLIQSDTSATAEEMKLHLVNDLKSFRDGAALADDQTFLVAIARPLAASVRVPPLAVRVKANT